MPKWIHDRAKHIRKKNPDLPEGAEWGIATQQGYATKKAPKGFGTPAGKRKAKKKYKKPAKKYEQKAAPKHKKSETVYALIALADLLDSIDRMVLANKVEGIIKSAMLK
jgi:hypothetical protein